jgi:hypothetical protein
MAGSAGERRRAERVVNPGEIWLLNDGTRRVVLSNATYNASRLNRVITAVVGPAPAGFDPFAVTTPSGTVYVDRIAMHPRHWLTELVVDLPDDAAATIRRHLAFLLCETG